MFLFYSFIFSKVCKYNFYNILVLINEFKELYMWFGFLLREIIVGSETFLNPLFIRWKATVNMYDCNNCGDEESVNMYLRWHQENLINFQYGLYGRLVHTYITYVNGKMKRYPGGPLWIWYPYVDTSFMRWKSVAFFFYQLSRIHLIK